MSMCNNILCHNNIVAGMVLCRNIPSKKLFYYYGELEMSEGIKQTIMLEVQDIESARILCETLSMNGYMTKAEKNKENFRGTWLVFVEVKEVEK